MGVHSLFPPRIIGTGPSIMAQAHTRDLDPFPIPARTHLRPVAFHQLVTEPLAIEEPDVEDFALFMGNS